MLREEREFNTIASQSPVDIILVRVIDTSMPKLKKIGAVQHPINLVYLATWLREQGHTAEIIDLEVEPQLNLEERLRTAPPYLVGITAMTPNIPDAKRVCELCRSLQIKSVLGGPHPTALPAQTLQETKCDYVVIGEGEKSLNELLTSIEDNRPCDNIEGIAFWKNGSAVINRRSPLIDLDSLPIPDRRFLKIDRYSGEVSPGIVGRGTTLFTSRGCPFECTFCASKVINQLRIRFRSMEKIKKEIDDIVSLGFNHINIQDDTFTINKQRVREFCLYLKSNYPQISWNCEGRVGALDDELFALMKEANFKKLAIGVESGSPRILKLIKKRIEVDQVKEYFKLVKKHKILAQAFFMIGFPEETLEDIRLTEKLIKEIKPDILSLTIVTPLPGTAIYEQMLKNGLITPGDWSYFVHYAEKTIWNTEHFTGEELVRMRKRISRNFYFRPSYMFKQVLSIRRIDDVSYLIRAGVAAIKDFLT